MMLSQIQHNRELDKVFDKMAEVRRTIVAAIKAERGRQRLTKEALKMHLNRSKAFRIRDPTTEQNLTNFGPIREKAL